jgi:hypothetical protein
MPYESNRDWGLAGRNNHVLLDAESAELINRKYAQVVSDSSTILALRGLVAGNYTYVAEAQPSASITDAVWRCKEVFDDGTNFSVKWADGNTHFDNLANDLASLTYI